MNRLIYLFWGAVFGALAAASILSQLTEWCADWYDAEYYSISPKQNPNGPESGRYRVMRGELQSMRRSCDREYGNPEEWGELRSFRCAQDVEDD